MKEVTTSNLEYFNAPSPSLFHTGNDVIVLPIFTLQGKQIWNAQPFDRRLQLKSPNKVRRSIFYPRKYISCSYTCWVCQGQVPAISRYFYFFLSRFSPTDVRTLKTLTLLASHNSQFLDPKFCLCQFCQFWGGRGGTSLTVRWVGT